MSLIPKLFNQGHTPERLQLPTGVGGKREIIPPSKLEPAQIQPHAPPGSLVVVMEGIEALRGATHESKGHHFLGERKRIPTECP